VLILRKGQDEQSNFLCVSKPGVRNLIGLQTTSPSYYYTELCNITALHTGCTKNINWLQAENAYLIVFWKMKLKQLLGENYKCV
jgi:hypothetical protein